MKFLVLQFIINLTLLANMLFPYIPLSLLSDTIL